MFHEMVVPRNVDNIRWMRRYKIFFIMGILILSFQLFLAYQFFTLNHSYNSWSPHKLSNSEIFESDSSVHLARRIKDGLSIDDEDINFNEKDKKKEKHNERNPQHNKTNIRLRVEELDFVPVCEIITREAISAIHRAKTQKCKQEISNTTCLIQSEMLYPKTLPNFCESEYSHLVGKSLGCFKDDKNFRILSGYYGNSKDKNSPEYCIYLCLQSGFSFAGVQYSTECFCGNDEPSLSLKLPDSSCNMKCPDTHLVCGGYYTMNIYYTGVKKFTAQVANESTSSSEAKVKVVFLLTLNGRALRQVKRLIKNLFHRDVYFYIHVDIRQDYLFRELLKLEKDFKNIKVTRKRFATIWGGASLLKMLMSSMKELLQMDWTWDFIINLSESDYPVKTVKHLIEFLSANKGKNFVKSHGREVQRFIQKQGLDKTFIECDTHMWRIGDRRLPWGVQIDGGSDWVALSYNFVQYVASDQSDELVAGLILLFKYTLLPAESFFHTVLRNSVFCNSYVDNNLHVTNWKRKLGCKCQYKHVVDWCGCSPNDFKPEDWLRIQNTESRQLFFARKFEPIINQAIILKLEEWLYGVDLRTKIKNVNSYWHNVYNHLDIDASDDAILTVSDSIARTTLKRLAGTNKCSLTLNAVLEVAYFHSNDMHKKTLVLFESYVNNFEKVILEIGFKLRDKLIIVKKTPLTKRLNTFFVSSDYDQKEQISRNFPRILGPHSEPTIMYEFGTDFDSTTKSANITFLWLDPTNKLVETSDLQIDDGFNLGYIKPVLKQPLLPGVWSIKLVNKTEVLAETKFLITPLRFYSRNVILQSQAEFVHGGGGYIKDFDLQWNKFVNQADRNRLEKLALANSKRFGPDLEEWIDSLVFEFYKADVLCAVNASVITNCWQNISKCENTDWSSLAPDPKSTITTINETSGMFDLW